MTPPKRRERLLAEDRAAFETLPGMGEAELLFSFTREMGLVQATRSRVFIDRIFVDDHERKARTAVTRHLQSMIDKR